MAKNQEKIEKTASIRPLEDTYTANFYNGVSKELFSAQKGTDVNILYDVVKTSPEVMGCIQAITEDICADEWKFIGSDSAIDNTEKFAIASDFYKVMANAVYELMITGNAYIVKLSVNQDKVKELMSVITKASALQLGVTFKKRTEVLLQDMTKPKDLQLMKSSTVTINYDETGQVVSYTQLAAGKERVFKKEDVIHLSLVNIGGEPYGFSGLEPLLKDIATLIFAKDFSGKYFENDGTPNFLFTMPEDNPDSRNFELLKKELTELKKKDQKFRNLVVTGNVGVQQIQKFNKDMEYSKLIQHFTQLVLIGLGVPTHRINYTLTDTQSGSQINRAYEGYYKKISFYQKIIENRLNKDLFLPHFKTELKFNRAYKLDEMREAQIAQITSQIGMMTIEELRDRMGLDPELPKGTLPNSIGDQAAINFDEDTRRQQGRDANPKVDPINTDNKLKSFTNEVDVSFNEFVLIVERYTGLGAFNKAKILYKETADEFILYFNDSSWVYKAIVNKSDIDETAFRVERLTSAVKIKY